MPINQSMNFETATVISTAFNGKLLAPINKRNDSNTEMNHINNKAKEFICIQFDTVPIAFHYQKKERWEALYQWYSFNMASMLGSIPKDVQCARYLWLRKTTKKNGVSPFLLTKKRMNSEIRQISYSKKILIIKLSDRKCVYDLYINWCQWFSVSWIFNKLFDSKTIAANLKPHQKCSIQSAWKFEFRMS